MRIMAGGQSNFRCFCDNSSELGHHLGGLWASKRSSGKPRKGIEGDFLPLLYKHYKNTTYILHKLVLLTNFFNKIQDSVTRKEKHCDGVGSEESLDHCYGNNMFASFPQDSYTMPLTSIQCWHVHCEECWLRTLVRLLSAFLLTYSLFPLFSDTLF